VQLHEHGRRLQAQPQMFDVHRHPQDWPIGDVVTGLPSRLQVQFALEQLRMFFVRQPQPQDLPIGECVTGDGLK